MNLIIFQIPPKYFKTIDTVGTRLIPVSILNEFNMDLNEFFGSPEEYLEGKNLHKADETFFWETLPNGKKYYHPWIITVQKDKFYPSYPIIFPLLNLPFYGMAKILNDSLEVSLQEIYYFDSLINQLDNFISSFWTTLGSLFLFIYIHKKFGLPIALGINFIYCFASPAFSLLSHNTWQHTLIVPLILLLILLLKSVPQKYQIFSGLILGLLPFIRPTGIFFLPLLLLAKTKYWKEWFTGILIGSFSALLLHLFIYSHPVGPYYYHSKMISDDLWNFNFFFFLETLKNQLFSPSRGLFIFLPYLLPTMIGIIYILYKEKNFRREILYLFIPVLLYLAFYSNYTFWHGGWNYGPRMLSDLLPIFMIYLAIFIKFLYKYIPVKIILILTTSIAFLIHIQPALSKDFLYWEQCYHPPVSYNEKIKDFQNPVFLAFTPNLRFLFGFHTIKISPEEVCSIKGISSDYTIHFRKEDFNKLIKFNDHYILFFIEKYYFPEGEYILLIKNYSDELLLTITGKEKFLLNIEEKGIRFTIKKSGFYSLYILKKNIDDSFIFENIQIQKVNDETKKSLSNANNEF